MVSISRAVARYMERPHVHLPPATSNRVWPAMGVSMIVVAMAVSHGFLAKAVEARRHTGVSAFGGVERPLLLGGCCVGGAAEAFWGLAGLVGWQGVGQPQRVCGQETQ